jgi:hypothetical protein
MGSSPNVLIAILNYNKNEETLRCLISVKNLNYPNFKVLVIDNGSEKDIFKDIKSVYPEAATIKLEDNVGAAAGRNVAIDYAASSQYEYILFLDNDTIIDTFALLELVKLAESDSNIAAVGTKTYYLDDKQKIWNFGGKINWLRGEFVDTCQGSYDVGQFDKIKEADTFPIGFGIVKTKVIREIGKIWEDYFIYYEETDWHVRMKKLGYKLMMCPSAIIWHDYSSPSQNQVFYYYRIRNRLLFMSRNAPKLEKAVFFFYYLFDFGYYTLLTLYLSEKSLELKAALLGVSDFLRGRFGKREFFSRQIKKGAIN